MRRFVFVAALVRAQDTQFLPEVDAYLKLNSRFRAYLQAKGDREGGDPTQFTFGPNIELYLKPLLKLKNITAFDLNDAKARAIDTRERLPHHHYAQQCQ